MSLLSKGIKITATGAGGQRVRFLVVGVWNTIFGYGAFVLLDALFSRVLRPPYFAYMSAMVLGQIIGILNAFVFHKLVTFRSAVRGWAMLAEFVRFSMTYALTFSLSLVLLPLLVEVFHFIPRVAVFIITLVCTVISYVGHSTFSFAPKATL